MTHATTLALLRRRNDLVAQIAFERAAIAQEGASLRRLSRTIDRIRDGIRYVRRHPETLLLPVVIAAVLRPRRLLTMAISGLGFWRMARIWRRRLLS